MNEITFQVKMKDTNYSLILIYAIFLLCPPLCLHLDAAGITTPHKYSVSYFSEKNEVENGLVNSIIQDHKGLLWFTTWSGLYRFDGYDFKHYQSNTTKNGVLTNNRLLNIQEDKYGFLWTLSYDSACYRFHPDKEKFEPILPDTLTANIRKITILPNGIIWLFHSNGKATRVITKPKDHSLIFENPLRNNAINVHSVYMDSTEQEWILTNNGLYHLGKSGILSNTSKRSISRKPISFQDATEANGQLIFGANEGKVYIYSHMYRSFVYKKLDTYANIIAVLNFRGNIVYVTDEDGFFIENKKTIKHIKLDNLTQIKDKHIESAQISSNGLLWLVHHSPGVTWYDFETDELNYTVGRDENNNAINTDTGFFMIEDINGYLWVHPKGGGFSYYDAQKKKLIPFNATEHDVKWKSNDRCFTAFSDNRGNLWMSTQLNRLKRISFISDNFRIHTPNTTDVDLPQNDIRALCIDKKGRIWSGSKDSEISIYNTDFKLLSHFKVGRVYAIMEDDNDVFWLSTKGDGLIKLEEFANYNFRSTTYKHDANDPYSLLSDNIYYTFKDRKKRLWIATYGGGLHLADILPDNKLRFFHHSNLLKNFPFEKFNKVRHVTEDQEGNIWISTTAGVVFVDGNFNLPQQMTFQPVLREPGNSQILSYKDVHMIKCTQNGKIFAVTYGGGINEIVRLKDGSFRYVPFTQKNGLPSDIIYSAQEDNENNLWLATAAGLVKFVNTKEQILYSNDHIAFNMHFNEGIAPTNGKLILMATNRGIFYFSPEKVKKSQFAPRIFFSSIWINNEEQDISANLDNITNLSLPPNTHSLRLVFSTLDMIGTEYIQYAYMLEGFDNTYRQTNNIREANYTNIPPGKYTFHLKSTNNEGVWMDNERILSIEVLPNFTQTILAKIIFVILIVVLIYIIIHVYTIFYRMRQQMRNEELMSELKMNFFTNISHELRTPLTLISAPLEIILKDQELPDRLKEPLDVMKMNSNRMQRLIGQILDFSQIQDNKMMLSIQYTDIVDFTAEVVKYFTTFAQERHIILEFTTEHPHIYIWFDPNKIEKVIFNILSNAFKYTQDYTTISVRIESTEKEVSIKVADQGIGIPGEKQTRIFDRFENLLPNNGSTKMSSGIGLSVAKQFVEMHKGTIGLESETGKGSIFSINLLKGKEHYPTNTEYTLEDLKDSDIQAATPDFESNIDESENLQMLIVEDDRDLRILMKQIFGKKYQIIEAADGNEGLSKAFSVLPDIIISDIMMPIKNGMQMLQELKEDERTSHIPTILLTAKSDMNSILTGIKSGADDYITKPFSVSYIQEKVDNLLLQRTKLQEYYKNKSNEELSNIDEKEDVPQLSEKDSIFLEQLSKIMEQQIDNTELNVDFIVSCFNLSRTNFFHKLKSLTGLSPITYIKEKRMKKAAELIKTQQYSISEIAYMVGYSDPHYFSKSFKSFWGVTATEYIKDRTNGKFT